MDMDSPSWIAALQGAGAKRSEALFDLHEMLIKVAVHETYRRGTMFRICGPELNDLAHQAANDAMVAILGKLDTFRRESRFTTWAYRFVALEVSSKVRRHFSSRPSVVLDLEEWERIPDRFDADPLAQTQHHELIAAVRHAVCENLTDHQHRFFVAAVIEGTPMDAMVAESGLKRGAIYKAVFDARRKIRAHLTANGYLDKEWPSVDQVDRPEEVVATSRLGASARATLGTNPPDIRCHQSAPATFSGDHRASA